MYADHSPSSIRFRNVGHVAFVLSLICVFVIARACDLGHVCVQNRVRVLSRSCVFSVLFNQTAHMHCELRLPCLQEFSLLV